MITSLALVTGLLAGIGPASVQPTLEEEALRFSERWLAKDDEALGGSLSSDGILLHLPDEKHNRLQPRQARAAIQAFLRRYPEGEVAVTRVSQAEGDVGRGFAEIRWTTGSPGAGEPVIFTVFVAFAEAGDSWDVTEIRVLF